MTSFVIFAIVALFICFILLVSAIKIVPQSEEWTLERFGKFVRILQPGVHVITPFVERIGVRLSMRECVLDVPHQDVISKENAMVTVDGVAFYRIFDSQKAAYMISNLPVAISQLVVTNIRTVLGGMRLDSMLADRDLINEKLLRVVDEATDPWGVKVIRVEIKDIKASRDLQEAMSKETKAERMRRAVEIEADAKRNSARIEAQGYSEAMVLRSKADRECAFLESEALERRAAAKAKTMELLTDSIKKDERGAQYLLVEKRIESLQAMATASNSKTIFMPFEVSKMVGGLGSLAELTKEMLLKKEGKQDHREK